MHKASEEAFGLGCVERGCLGMTRREVANEARAPLSLWNPLDLGILSLPSSDLVGLLLTEKCGFGTRLRPVGLCPVGLCRGDVRPWVGGPGSVNPMKVADSWGRLESKLGSL